MDIFNRKKIAKLVAELKVKTEVNESLERSKRDLAGEVESLKSKIEALQTAEPRTKDTYGAFCRLVSDGVLAITGKDINPSLISNLDYVGNAFYDYKSLETVIDMVCGWVDKEY